MNNNQFELFPLPLFSPFTQPFASFNLNPHPFSPQNDGSIGILQEFLKMEALRNAKNATIDQITRMEDYFAKNLNSTLWPK